jgi:ribose 1,5-bisphosphate isomerase
MTFSKVTETANKIKSLEIQGAINIAREASKAVQYVIEKSKAKTKAAFVKDIKEAGKILKNTRPSAVALPNAVDLLVEHVEDLDGDLKDVKKNSDLFVKNFIPSIENSVKRISWFGAKKIKKDMRILLHCHSSTAVSILKLAKKQKKKFEVLCTETRPWRQGFITAKELSNAGIDTTLIVDSAVATVMQHIDMVLVGADTIAKNGDLINKIGTSGIGIIAKQHGVPLYSATSTLKFGDVMTGEDVKIEERDTKEILEGKSIGKAKVWNPVFDVTPSEYIYNYITEDGLQRPEEIFEG